MRTTLFLMLCVLSVGCDTVNQARYRIASAASPTDRAQVRAVLQSVATQTKLSDQTPTSRAPHTLVFYTQPNVEHFRVELGARTVGSDIIVELFAGFGPQPSEYKLAHRLLAPALTQAFGSRVTEIDFAHQIP